MNSSKKSSKKTSSKAPIAKLKELKEVVLKNDNDNEWNTEQTDEVIGKIEAVLKRNLLSSTSLKSNEVSALKFSMIFLINSCKNLIFQDNWEEAETLAVKVRLLFEKLFIRLEEKFRPFWLGLKISIYCNLATIYKKMKKSEHALNILKPLINDKNYESLIQISPLNFDHNLLGLENLYMLYGECLYSLQNYEEALLYIEKSFEFLKSILENYETIHRNSQEMQDKKNEFMKYLDKKRNMIGFCFYLRGKICERTNKNHSAKENYQIALKIMEEIEGPHGKTTIKYIRRINHLQKNMEFLNIITEPIKFDIKEIKAKESFYQPNQDLFSKSKALEKEEKKQPQKKKFMIPRIFEDETSSKKPVILIPPKIEIKHDGLHSERKREHFRTNSNPMLFSFLTDRKRASLQMPPDYFDMMMIKKDQLKLKQHQKNKLGSEDFKTFRIKNDAYNMCEYYSKQKFSNDKIVTNTNLHRKNFSINTPSTSARAHLQVNESSISSIKMMKFELMRNHRPQSSNFFIKEGKEKKTPREDMSASSIKTNKSKSNQKQKEPLKKSVLAFQKPKSKQSLEKSRRLQLKDEGKVHTEPAINLIGVNFANLKIPGVDFRESFSRLPSKRESSVSDIPDININLMTLRDVDSSRQIFPEIEDKEIELMRRNRFILIIQKKIREFLLRKRRKIEAEEQKKQQKILEEQLKKQQETMKETLKKPEKIMKDQSLMLDDIGMGSMVMTDDEFEEGKARKMVIKKFQSFKINNFTPFVLNWRNPFRLLDHIIVRTVKIFFNVERKSCTLEFFLVSGRETASLRLITHDINDKELALKKNCWVIFGFLMNVWLLENNLSNEINKFKDINFRIYFNQFPLSDEEYDDFNIFINMFSFLISLSFVKVKKVVGSCWKIGDLQENQILRSNRQKIYNFSKEKRSKTRKIVCRLSQIKSSLLSHLGYERKLETLNPTTEYDKFFRNFQIPLQNALLKKTNLFGKFSSMRNIKGKKMSFAALMQWSQPPVKSESFEKVLQLLEDKNYHVVVRNSESHHRLEAPHNEKMEAPSLQNISGLLSKEERPKNTFAMDFSQNTLNFNSCQDLNSNLISEATHPKFHSLGINEKPSIFNKSSVLSLILDKNSRTQKPVRRTQKRKVPYNGVNQYDILKNKDLYMNDKPFVIKEDEEMERFREMTFPKNDALLKFLKKCNDSNYFMVALKSDFDFQNDNTGNHKIIAPFTIDLIFLKGKENEFRNFEKNKISFEELSSKGLNKMYANEELLQSILLNQGFRSSQKLLLLKNLEGILFAKKIQVQKFRFYRTIRHKKFNLENLKHFELPSFEKIYKVPFKILKINYFHSQNQLSRVYWRFNFSLKNNQNILIIGMYAPLLKVMNYSIIRERSLQEKLIHLIKKVKSSSEHIKHKLLGKYIYEKIVWIGKKLIFAEKRKETLKIKQRGITASNYQELKFSILFKTIDIYIKTYFNKRTLYEATYIVGIGKCYIKVKYFCANHAVKTQHINKFLKFEIIPQTKRNKLFKFIISDCDFEIYFNLKMDFLNAREFLIFINKNIFNRLTLFKTTLYSKLKIPYLLNFDHTTNFYLENVFRPIECEQKKLPYFLEKKCNLYRIILQVTCKIDKHFIIVTVKKNRILNNYHLCLYFQVPCRNFSCNFSMEEIQNLDCNFLARTFPYEFDFVKNNKFNNYMDFRDQLIKTKQKLKEIELREEIELNLGFLLGVLQEKGAIKYPFVEKFVWERLVKSSQMVFTAKNKTIFTINDYRGVLREELSQSNLLFNETNILLEMTYYAKKVLIPFRCYPKIPFETAKNYKVFMKIFNLHTGTTHCQAFTARELIFAKMKLENNKTINLQYQQNHMKTLAFFWSTIFHKIIVFPNEKNKMTEYNQNFFGGDYDLEKKKIDLNSKMKLNEINEQNKNFLIFKTILTIKPRQSFCLNYNPKENNFICFLFIHSGCLKIRKLLEFPDLENIVPNLKYLLGLREYQLIGQYLVRKMKNSLIINANYFYQKNKINS